MDQNIVLRRIGLGVILLNIVVVLAVMSPFLIAGVWGWIVPDVFSGAVANGNLPAGLTLAQAIKLSILVWVLGLTVKAISSSGNKS